MDKFQFGRYLQSLRKEAALSIYKLSKLSGVSHSYISQIERGEKEIPSPEILSKLAGHLNESPLNLMIYAGYINLDDDFSTKTIDLIKSQNMFKGRRKNPAIVHLTTVIFAKLDDSMSKFKENDLAVTSYKKTNDLLIDYLDDNEVTVDQVIQQNSSGTIQFDNEILEDKGIIYMMLEALRYIDEKELQIQALNQQLEEQANCEIQYLISKDRITYNKFELTDEDKQRLLSMLPILFPQYHTK